MECNEKTDQYFDKETNRLFPDDKFITIEEIKHSVLIKERQETIKKIIE